MKEIERLENLKFIKKLRKEVNTMMLHERILRKLKLHFLYAFAGFFIASLLPNEFGDLILASIKGVKSMFLIIMSFILSSLGILILLLL